MRVAAAASVLACLVLGLLGGSAFREWGVALDSARAESAQLVRIQTIQNDLVKADAVAANSYLRGGSEEPATRALYDAAISDAARRLAQPAASAANSTTLETAVDGLTRYVGLVAQARANNVQGMQVGAAYQRAAGDVLRKEIVPALEQVSRSDQERVAAAYDQANLATLRLIGAGVVAVLGLVLVQLWLAVRTRRVFNLPLAGATVAVLVALTVGFSVLGTAADRVDQVASGPYATTVALSQARTAAFDAKARESFGLINRGNATADEKIAKAKIIEAMDAMDTAQAHGGATAPMEAFVAWSTLHDAVRAADDTGDWPKAQALAVGRIGQTVDSNTVFATFDTVSKQELDRQAADVDAGLSGSRMSLVILGWLTLIFGLLAALASYSGVSQRLGEYR
jgi:CHASE3 domain sensor protein